MWDPECYAGSSTPGLWTSTADPAGGQATSLASIFEYLTHNLVPGTGVSLVGPAKGVTALLSATDYIAVNTTGQPRVASIGEAEIALAPYQVAMGKIPTSSSIGLAGDGVSVYHRHRGLQRQRPG